MSEIRQHDPTLDADAQRLKELGYDQQLERSWGGFTNFAISFSIISILAGCFTTYGQAWNNGGPVAISWGWPVLSAFILIIAFCMSEILSAYPTAGGIYYWSLRLGGPAWGWFTGWFNIVGLIGVVASVDYGAALFCSYTIGLFDSGYNAFSLTNIFIIYAVFLAAHTVLNLFPAHILRWWNDLSAYWHVIGPAIVVVILIFFVQHGHQSISFVFTERINNSGFFNGSNGGFGYWFYVLPLGFLLTQYTITGFDACAHLSEETRGAAHSAARGLWQAVFWSAIGGWIILLAFTFAATQTDFINNVNGDNPYGAGYVVSIFASNLGIASFKIIMIIATIGQFFCAGSGMTSASRMMFAFSRDRAVPGHQLWSKVTRSHAPANATLAVAVLCLIVALPALKGNANNYPFAFYAMTQITVIGLYIAYAIPIYLRWRQGDNFTPGPWSLGSRYRWMCPIAVAEVIVVCIYFSLPFAQSGIPGREGFALDNGAVNYAPVLVFGVVLAAGIWWMVSAKNWFTGPDVASASSVEAELDRPAD
jgi:amino acid transporter